MLCGGLDGKASQRRGGIRKRNSWLTLLDSGNGHSMLQRSGLCWSCPTLCDPTDCSPPGSSVHGIFHARVLEWVAISYSRGSSWPRDQARVSCVSWTGRWILYHSLSHLEAHKAPTLQEKLIKKNVNKKFTVKGRAVESRDCQLVQWMQPPAGAGVALYLIIETERKTLQEGRETNIIWTPKAISYFLAKSFIGVQCEMLISEKANWHGTEGSSLWCSLPW